MSVNQGSWWGRIRYMLDECVFLSKINKHAAGAVKHEDFFLCVLINAPFNIGLAPSPNLSRTGAVPNDLDPPKNRAERGESLQKIILSRWSGKNIASQLRSKTNYSATHPLSSKLQENATAVPPTQPNRTWLFENFSVLPAGARVRRARGWFLPSWSTRIRREYTMRRGRQLLYLRRQCRSRRWGRRRRRWGRSPRRWPSRRRRSPAPPLSLPPLRGEPRAID